MLTKEYFQDKELLCPCGCGKMPDPKSVEMLYAVRIIYGKPIILNSAARCDSYNMRIGGAPSSTHLIGAFDTTIPKEDEWEFIRILQMVGFTGIGFQDNKLIHFDRHHKNPAIWGY